VAAIVDTASAGELELPAVLLFWDEVDSTVVVEVSSVVKGPIPDAMFTARILIS
jgi:hypothetical protein